MSAFLLSVLLPVNGDGRVHTVVHVYRIEHAAPDGLQWTREHADEIAQRMHGDAYCALMVSQA